MWEKYSNDNKGFCIGYNGKFIFPHLGGGGAVDYIKIIPDIIPQPFMSFEESRYIKIFNKSIKWAFEQEYRTTKFWEKPPTIEERQIELPAEAFKVIILGDKMPINHIKELTNAVYEHIGNIPILTRAEYLKM